MEKATNSFFWKPETPFTLRIEKILILNKRFFKKRNKRKIKKQIKKQISHLIENDFVKITRWKFRTLDAEILLLILPKSVDYKVL